MREKIRLNKGWSFVRKDVGYEALDKNAWIKWEKIDLPHTWNAVDGGTGAPYYRGSCWYKRTVSGSVTDTGKRVFLEFLGVNSIAEVILNEQLLGKHRGGFSTFRFDATRFWQVDGENEIIVRVDNTTHPDVYPQIGDFTFFGGIYRDVNLVITDDIHFSMLDAGSTGVSVIQDQIRDDHALLTIRTLVSNDAAGVRDVRLWVELLADDGHVVAYGARNLILTANSETEVLLPIQIDDPILWDGTTNPYLYEVHVSLEGENDLLDRLRFKTGLRWFELDPQQGFMLNGNPYRLNGVCRHQDRGDVGWAITREHQKEDMDCILEIGANAVRLAHYQHDPYFYELCDLEGIIVWTEIPFNSRMSTTDLTGANAKSQLVELIRQNINHPSICFWGIQNEIQIGGERPEARKLVSELNALAKFEDATRLTTMANLMSVPIKDAYNEITDAVAYNRYDGWYTGEMSDLGTWLDTFHTQRPEVCLGISEYGVDGILQYHSENPEKQDYTEEFQALYHETIWQILQARPWIWGTFIWNMFDFASSIRNEGGIRGRNNKGLVSYGRYLRKDAFYFYKAQWSAEKFVYIASRRFIERSRKAIDLKVYTNCDWVELTVNHSEYGRISGEGGVVVIRNVPLFLGYNLITATGYLTGETKDSELPVNRKSQAVFMRVEKPNPSYVAPAETRKREIPVWFKNA